MTCVDCERTCTGRLCRECERGCRWEDEFERMLGMDAAGASPAATDGGVIETDGFAPVVETPAPDECARALAQHPAVRDATVLRDCQSAFVEVTLTADTRGVPTGIVRILYRRHLAIVDVTPVARRHLQVTARPRRWAA